MGKYGIGKRVRDDEGDEGVIIDKAKGERLVEYNELGFDLWWSKKYLTPIGDKDEKVDDPKTDDEASETECPKYEIGQRVIASGRGRGSTSDIGFVTSKDDGGYYVEFRDGWKGGHDGGKGDGAKNRWWFYGYMLKPAPLEVGESAYDDFPIGSTGVIVKDYGGGSFEIKNDETGWEGYFFNCELELVTDKEPEPWTPSVGDKVRFTEKCWSGFWFGPTTPHKEGVVVKDDGDGFLPYHVKVDGREDVAYVDARHIDLIKAGTQAPTTLKIEAGKIYLDTNGDKVGPMRSHGDGFIEVSGDGRMWMPDGSVKKYAQGQPLVSLFTPSIGDTVTLAEPATVMALNGPNASLKLANGKSYDLPTTALVQA